MKMKTFSNFYLISGRSFAHGHGQVKTELAGLSLFAHRNRSRRFTATLIGEAVHRFGAALAQNVTAVVVGAIAAAVHLLIGHAAAFRHRLLSRSMTVSIFAIHFGFYLFIYLCSVLFRSSQRLGSNWWILIAWKSQRNLNLLLFEF
jgi:hypothetical protein